MSSAGVALAVLLTVAASAVAGLLAVRLRLPGGAIVWAIAAAAALHLSVTDLAPLPESLRTAAQVLIGTTIGVGVTRGPLRALRAVRWQVALTMALLFGACVLAGVVLASRTPLDLSTALLSTGPGGASDMAVVAVPFHVDPALVAGLQVLRQLLVFGLVPVVFGLLAPPPAGPDDS